MIVESIAIEVDTSVANGLRREIVVLLETHAVFHITDLSSGKLIVRDILDNEAEMGKLLIVMLVLTRYVVGPTQNLHVRG